MSTPKTEQELWEQGLRDAILDDDLAKLTELCTELDAMEQAGEEADNADDPGYSEWEDPGIPKH